MSKKFPPLNLVRCSEPRKYLAIIFILKRQSFPGHLTEQIFNSFQKVLSTIKQYLIIHGIVQSNASEEKCIKNLFFFKHITKIQKFTDKTCKINTYIIIVRNRVT